jgi:Domain of unknown function (DUF309)
MIIGVTYFFVAIGSMLRPRWLPQNSLPPYAYLPGKKPHPVRDPTGHSYHVEPIPVAAEASLGSDAFLWGLDLFNHGYYWEAHEAWESNDHRRLALLQRGGARPWDRSLP